MEVYSGLIMMVEVESYDLYDKKTAEISCRCVNGSNFFLLLVFGNTHFSIWWAITAAD